MTSSPFKNNKIVFHYLKKEDLENPINRTHDLSFSHSSLKLQRKQEFVLGRVCALKALNKLGFHEDFVIKKGTEGEPIWPDGITGSISHSKNNVVAAVCFKKDFSGIGLDIELSSRKKNLNIFNRILCEKEMDWILSIKDKEQSYIKALQIFSLKEACFKAFFSAYAIKLKFKDAVFTEIDTENFLCTINSKIIVKNQHKSFEATSKLSNNLIVSGVCLSPHHVRE